MFIQIDVKELIEQDIIKREDDEKDLESKILSYLAKITGNPNLIFCKVWIIRNMIHEIIRFEINIPLSALKRREEIET